MPGTNQPSPLPTELEGFLWMSQVAPIFNSPTVSRKNAMNWKNSGHTLQPMLYARIVLRKGEKG